VWDTWVARGSRRQCRRATPGLDVRELAVDAVQIAYRNILSTDIKLSGQPTPISLFSNGTSVALRAMSREIPLVNLLRASSPHAVIFYKSHFEPNQTSISQLDLALLHEMTPPPYSVNQTYMPPSSLDFRTRFKGEANRRKAMWIGDGGDNLFNSVDYSSSKEHRLEPSCSPLA